MKIFKLIILLLALIGVVFAYQVNAKQEEILQFMSSSRKRGRSSRRKEDI
jgi:hypothetical protein